MKQYIGTFVLVLGVVLTATGCHGLHGKCRNCQTGCGPTGCRPGHIGWQRGGTDYQKALSHHAYRNPEGGGSGVTAAQTAYPYYTNRGPRDFFVNNPPTIGR
ncbi:MAG: hypothetical protein NTW52_06700 [Planctomycetota bacterium]|jgi:hypothetical protein|nr:hypothetical protein [Planctomycetota bacterium]